MRLENSSYYDLRTDIIEETNIFDNTFPEVQRKIKCACICCFTKEDTMHSIVLKENYTKEEFLKFLRELKNDIEVKSIHGRVFSNIDNSFWKCVKDDKLGFRWVFNYVAKPFNWDNVK